MSKILSVSKQKEVRRGYFYNGPSMVPTFRTGQLLYVRPNADAIKPGDIVVFKKNEKYVVHRVVGNKNGNYITRGDNNLLVDNVLVSNNQIVGRVEITEDNKGISRLVQGGTRALMKSRLRWWFKEIIYQLCLFLGAPYRWLKSHRWITKVWRPEVTSIRLQTPNSILVKYVVGGKTVAIWQPQQARFACRRPYDLIIFPPIKK